VATGLVKWFNQVSGYGFIAPDETGPDRYVRRENVIGAPSTVLAHARVRFEPREGGMGPEAINVRLLGR
jgi:cold shock protein